jgi:hypothetical protein
MKRRIKQLMDNVRQPTPISIPIKKVPYTRELELAIKADVLAKRYYTYDAAAELVGCSTEKMRLLAQGYPINRVARPHRIPECVLKLIIRDNTILADHSAG